MGRRRAGEWARRRARARRRELIRAHWRPLLGLAAVIVVSGVLAAVLAAWIIGAWLAWIIVGAWYAGATAIWIIAFELVDPVARHWLDGADAEAWSAKQLRSLERSGWRAVHNIMLVPGDIDHVAVGPGGVVAIETKSSDGEWDWLVARGVAQRWASQAADSAARVRALVKQHTAMVVEVRPVVAVWARGLGDDGDVRCRGVRVVHGRSLAEELAGYGSELVDAEVDRIHAALEAVARGLDAHRAAHGTRR